MDVPSLRNAVSSTPLPRNSQALNTKCLWLKIFSCRAQGAPLAAGQGVPIEYAGEQDGEELPRRHDRRKQECAVAPDGVRDEELPCRRAAHTGRGHNQVFCICISNVGAAASKPGEGRIRAQ